MLNSKKGKVLIYLGVILLFASTSFLIHQRERLKSKKEEVIRLEENLLQDVAINQSTPQKLKSDVEKKEETIPEIGTEKSHNADEITSFSLGVIRIDEIGVILPIKEDASQESLIDGVGIVEGTDFPSSKKETITVLAGHRGGRNEELSFLNIDELEEGDEIKITTTEEILYYSVVGQEVIEANDWSKFIREEGKIKLFLMSCHPYPQYYQRLLVKADLVESITNDK